MMGLLSKTFYDVQQIAEAERSADWLEANAFEKKCEALANAAQNFDLAYEKFEPRKF